MPQKIIFFAPVVWNFYVYRDQELPKVLTEKGYKCTFVNPVRYNNWQKGSIRLKSLVNNPVPSGMNVVERYSKCGKSIFSFIYENFNNILQIKKNKPDAVISTDHLMSLAACIYCRIKKIIFVFDNTDDWDNVDTNIFTGFYWKNIAKPLLRKYAYAITSTSYMQSEYFKKKNKMVYIIPNGKTKEFIKTASQFKEPENNNVVNFIASLRNWYDFDLLFDVFNAFPQLQLNIYGVGDLLEELTVKSENYSNISMKGNIDMSEVPRLISESLFGILPLKLNKLNESTCPVKLFEYWSAGKTVIASPTHEIKILGNDCILFAENKTQYIEHINKLLVDKRLRESLGKLGLYKMETIHNYDNISQKFESIIN